MNIKEEMEEHNTSSAQGRALLTTETVTVGTSSFGRTTAAATAASPKVGQSPTSLKSLA